MGLARALHRRERRTTVELIRGSVTARAPNVTQRSCFAWRRALASARSMLEGNARGRRLGDETSVRAALHLCLDYDYGQSASCRR